MRSDHEGCLATSCPERWTTQSYVIKSVDLVFDIQQHLLTARQQKFTKARMYSCPGSFLPIMLII
uniref:Uncharacterized protein n=1 Tax=Romanomermis culicivorax TaxID=13658 RepID=A0A915JJW3_ROMCU